MRSRRQSRGKCDSGSVVLELVVVTALLLPAVLWGALAAAQVASGRAAIEQAANMAAQSFATARSEAAGRLAAQDAARQVLDDHGWAAARPLVVLSCTGPCLMPGTAVMAQVRWRLHLSAIPLGDVTVPLQSQQRVAVDDFRADPA